MRYLLLLPAVVLTLATNAPAETYVVNPEGTGDFPTIQAAIDSVVDGDTIELTEGTFTGEGNRDIDYVGKAITVRSQSGNPYNCVIDCGGSPADPHRGFVFYTVGPASVLEGVTVMNGWDPDGGGIFIVFASPTIIRCVLSANVAQLGGGLQSTVGSQPTLTECTFLGNSAEFGGGICV